MTGAATAVGAVIVHRGRAFVLRRAVDSPFLPGRWDVPGGPVGAGEPVEDALRRAVADVTGWVLRSVVAELPGLSWTEPDGTTTRTRTFLVTVDGDLRHPHLAAGEHDQWRWVAADELALLGERRGGGDDDVATLVAAGLMEATGHPEAVAGRPRRPARPRLRMAAYLALVVLAEAAVVWFAFRLDGPAAFAGMLVPEAILAATGAALTLAPLALLALGRRRTPHLALGAGVTTVAMVALSWFFGLPVKALLVDPAAGAAARHLLARAPGSVGSAPACSAAPSVTGPVAPLVHAERACVMTSDPRLPLVEFTDAPTGVGYPTSTWRALLYSPGTTREPDGSHVPPEPDQCVQHLAGPWWAMAPLLGQGTGPCPVGYRFLPGG